MARQKYLWIVERKIGSWSSWIGKGNRGPMPDSQGIMKFGKGDYAIDPKKFRIWKVPKGIRRGDILKIQLWREDETVPIDYFAPEKVIGDGFTATLLHEIAKLKRLQLSRVNKENDKVAIMLTLALIIAMGAIAILAYLVVNK